MILTNFHLKLIALITMTIDHIGYIFFPDIIELRIIGRIAFIIFAFLLTEGFMKTSNLKRYIGVIAIFGFTMSLFEYLGNEFLNIYVPPNIFLTLFFGLVLMFLLDKILESKNIINNIGLSIILVLIFTIFGSIVDYGYYGFSIIIMFYMFSKFKFNNLVIKYCLMFVIFNLISLFYNQFPVILYQNSSSTFLQELANNMYISSVQLYGAFALIFIFMYNFKRGFYNVYVKYLIYVYYPLHLVVFYYISELL